MHLGGLGVSVIADGGVAGAATDGVRISVGIGHVIVTPIHGCID